MQNFHTSWKLVKPGILELTQENLGENMKLSKTKEPWNKAEKNTAVGGSVEFFAWKICSSRKWLSIQWGLFSRGKVSSAWDWSPFITEEQNAISCLRNGMDGMVICYWHDESGERSKPQCCFFFFFGNLGKEEQKAVPAVKLYGAVGAMPPLWQKTVTPPPSV